MSQSDLTQEKIDAAMDQLHELKRYDDSYCCPEDSGEYEPPEIDSRIIDVMEALVDFYNEHKGDQG